MSGFIIGLLILNVLLILAIVRLVSFSRAGCEPSSLPATFKHIFKYIRYKGTWNEMEFVRKELRRALYELETIRHDVNNVRLRNTKPARNIR